MEINSRDKILNGVVFRYGEKPPHFNSLINRDIQSRFLIFRTGCLSLVRGHTHVTPRTNACVSAD